MKPPNKYEMRSIGTVLEPKCKTKLDQFSISYRSPQLWNKLIVTKPNLTQIDKFSSFRNNVKKLLLANENIYSSSKSLLPH